MWGGNNNAQRLCQPRAVDNPMISALRPSIHTRYATTSVAIQRRTGAESFSARDELAIEEPLEIRLRYHDGDRPVWATVAVTMRTPGDDVELAAGFLFTEGIVRDRSDIADIRSCGPTGGAAREARNVVRVEVAPGTSVDIRRLDRPSYTTSSCGLCGKTSLDALSTASRWPLPPCGPAIED